MPNIATVLKDEISRVARREIKGEIEAIKKASSRYRSDIAELKRQIAQLQRQVAQLSKQAGRATKTATAATEKTGALRFRADGLRKHRERLGLTAVAASRLLGVSALTLYNWETGKTKPRQAQLAKIAELRRLGKRDVAERLAAK